MDIEIQNSTSEEITQKIRNNELNGMIEILKNEEREVKVLTIFEHNVMIQE